MTERSGDRPLIWATRTCRSKGSVAAFAGAEDWMNGQLSKDLTT